MCLPKSFDFFQESQKLLCELLFLNIGSTLKKRQNWGVLIMGHLKLLILTALGGIYLYFAGEKTEAWGGFVTR